MENNRLKNMNVEELGVVMDDDSIQIGILENDIDNLNCEINDYFDSDITISNKTYNIIHNKIEDSLYAVADLSLPYFELNERLRYYYFNKYRSQPIVGRNKYFDRYEQLHKPYTKLKNRCYRMFNKLDKIKKNI